jgi:hypothetical protein
MPNRWTQFVREWADDNNMSYGCALSKPECKNDYHRKYLTKKYEKSQQPKEVEQMGAEDINVAKKPKKQKEKQNIRLIIEEDEPATKKKGRKPKYATDEERKKAKREQTLASNKKMATMRKEYLQQARENIAMGKEDKEGKGVLKNIQKGFKKVGRTIKKGVLGGIDVVENIGNQAIKGIERVADKTADVAEDVAGRVEDYGKAVIYGRMDYPPKVRDILKKYGQEVISGLTIMRTPVAKVLTGALSLFSLGKFGKRMSRSFDELFHLFLEIRTESGKRLSVEKNEVINMDINPQKRDKTEVKDVVNNVPQGLTIEEMLNKTEQYMGKRKFFSYSAKDNNCQDFIVSIFKANNIGDGQDITFIKQDTKSLFKDLPYLRKLSNTITDIGGRFNVITTGRGVAEINNYGEVLAHLIEHIKDPKEPIDPRDYKQAVKMIKAIEKEKKSIEGGAIGDKDYIVQSVIFAKDKWTTPKAKKWLKEHQYKSPAVDKKENVLRFRQIEPDYAEKQGFTEYRTKDLEDSGISLILAYKKNIISTNNISMGRKPKMTGEGAIPTQMLIEKRMYGGAICAMCKHHIDLHHSDSDSDMEGGKINIGKAFKKLGSDIKKGFNKEIARPITSVAKTIDRKVIDPAGDYITAKKGGLATDVIKFGIPAVAGATLGGLAGLATGGNPVAGVAASALGSKFGSLGAKELQKATGTGVRKGRFAKGSQEAKDYMRMLREKRGKN